MNAFDTGIGFVVGVLAALWTRAFVDELVGAVRWWSPAARRRRQAARAMRRRFRGAK